MADDSLAKLLVVASQAVRLKQIESTRTIRRAVAREIHTKQAGKTEVSIARVVSKEIDKQVDDIAKKLGTGSKLNSKENLKKWKNSLIDAVLPVLAIKMAEAAVAQMIMVGVNPRSKGARVLTQRKHEVEDGSIWTRE